MPPRTTQHISVLADEVLHWLRPQAGQTLVDGTMGGGGHTRLLAQAVHPGGLVIGLDCDPAAVEAAEEEFEEQFEELPIQCIHENYSLLPEVLQALSIESVDGILLDLGLSSDQLADQDRGFSFHSTGPLDLRFDPTRGEPAWKMLARLSEQHLTMLLSRYGEERYSKRIARTIVQARRKTPVKSAAQLAELVRQSVPRVKGQRIDPATKTFQALRIVTNGELDYLETSLKRLSSCLRPGGRLAVISFHSLEDRLVKRAFRGSDDWEELTRRPLGPTEAEVARNPRSRSAKFRVAAKPNR